MLLQISLAVMISVCMADISLSSLAKQALPDAYRHALSLLQLNESTQSGAVKPLRVSLLEARELLDIFSYVYPVSLADNGSNDTWNNLRHDLDIGYEVLGGFQDLDHSGVEWNVTDEQIARSVCLDWQKRMRHHAHRRQYDKYVSQPSNGTFFVHAHPSKFFWGYKGVAPSPALTGLQNLGRMVRDSQLAQMLDSYKAVISLRHIYLEPQHSQFHNFRKLIRSILAVATRFPQLLPAMGSSSEAAAADGAPRHQPEAAVATAEAAPAATARQAGQTGLLIAGSRRMARRLTVFSSAPAATTAAAHIPEKVHQLPGVVKCNPWLVVDRFQQLFKDLGQINNQIFAYQFYKDRGEAAKAAQLSASVEQGWVDLIASMQRENAQDMARCLAASMPSPSPTL